MDKALGGQNTLVSNNNNNNNNNNTLTLADFRSDDQRRRRTLLLFDVLAVVVRANAVFETRRRSEGGRGRRKHFVPFFSEKVKRNVWYNSLFSKMSWYFTRGYTFTLYITKERNGHHRYALSASLVSRRLLVRHGHNVTFFVFLSLSISLFSKSERTIR